MTTAKSKQDLSKVFQERITRANARLKAAHLGVVIKPIGGKLYLVATLPPKPGSTKTKAHQQRITLGLGLNGDNIERAEREARKVAGLLACKEFSWEPYLKVKSTQPQTIGDWLGRFEEEFRASVAAVTWQKDYANAFKKLPATQPLTVDVLKAALLETDPNSKTRRRCCLAFSKLARFAGLEVNFKLLQGNYSASEVEPRDLPSDSIIVEWFHQIRDPGWKWIYGMLATFGLRSHEAFFLDTEDLELGKSDSVFVLEGKTGKRRVWAYYPEWIEQFDLRCRVLPRVTGKEHADFTHRACKYYGQYAKLPFTPLDLRHRWAIRTLEFGLPTDLSAKQMGHSVMVHERTYQRWIKQDVHQRMYEILTARSDRPKAPQLP